MNNVKEERSKNAKTMAQAEGTRSFWLDRARLSGSAREVLS
jgi:hypothetical protein